MNIVIADGDVKALSELENILKRIYPEGTVVTFTDPMYAVKYALNFPVDIAFTEVKMKYMDGLTLIQVLRQKYCNMKAVIVTDADPRECNVKQFRIDGYLQKPVSLQGVLKVVEHL